MINQPLRTKLIKAAKEVIKNSYSHHSGFRVGSALLGKSGRIYKGTNVEFDAFSLTVCAERAALFAGIAGGDKIFNAAAIVTSSKEFIYPCGLCRQALVEFNPDMEIILITKGNKIKSFILKDIMPDYFKLNLV